MSGLVNAYIPWAPPNPVVLEDFDVKTLVSIRLKSLSFCVHLGIKHDIIDR